MILPKKFYVLEIVGWQKSSLSRLQYEISEQQTPC